MWRAGEAAFGKDYVLGDNRIGRCWQPTWSEIYPPSPGCSGASHRERFLGKYPGDIPGGHENRPLYDLRKVLWCLERINVARAKKEENLDEELLVALIGWNAVWWRIATRRLDRELGAILQPLDQLVMWILEKYETERKEGRGANGNHEGGEAVRKGEREIEAEGERMPDDGDNQEKEKRRRCLKAPWMAGRRFDPHDELIGTKRCDDYDTDEDYYNFTKNIADIRETYEKGVQRLKELAREKGSGDGDISSIL